MGTAALTARRPIFWRRAASPRAPACGLAFDRPREALVAVCALAGGSGASTLALALAGQAARESRLPVLVTELGREHAALAGLAGEPGSFSLEQVAAAVAAGQPPARPFAEPEPGLRLLAGPPGAASAAGEEVAALLLDARAAHGLVVVDCGPRWPAAVLEHATHLLWTLPARPAALNQAQVLLESGALPPPGRWREALVASALERGARASRELRRVAAVRGGRLVLSPYRGALAAGRLEQTPALLADTLARLARPLRGGR